MAATSANGTRKEKDSIGYKEIPANVYYGIQTARAVENYPISGMRAHPTLIRAFGMVKQAATEANKELGLLDAKQADAIIQAAKEVQEGKWHLVSVENVEPRVAQGKEMGTLPVSPRSGQKGSDL